jgi:hypothetical protein
MFANKEVRMSALDFSRPAPAHTIVQAARSKTRAFPRSFIRTIRRQVLPDVKACVLNDSLFLS